MVIRTLYPLNAQEWEILAKDLERGPTDEQTKFIREAMEHADTLITSYDD